MAESSKTFFDVLGDSFSDLSARSESKILKNIFDWISKLLKGELSKETTKRQEELDALATDLVNQQLDLTDKVISDKEKEILEKIKKLDENDKKIETWFTWIEETKDEEFIAKEKHDILSRLQTESDDDKDKQTDLFENEFNEVAGFVKKKNDLCESVLKCEDDNFKNLPDNLKTKQEIVDSFNKVLEELKNNNTDYVAINSVTKELIIENLKSKQTS